MKAHELLTLYNRLTQRLCGRPGTFPLSHSANMLKAAGAFLTWAKRNEVDARYWIIARHDAIRWCRRIPLKDLHQVGDEFRDKYDGWMVGRMASMDQEVSDRKSVVDDTDRVAELTMLGEACKAAFAAEPEVCLGSATALTGGWHPDSEWCQQCRVSSDCRRLLPPRTEWRRCDARR